VPEGIVTDLAHVHRESLRPAHVHLAGVGRTGRAWHRRWRRPDLSRHAPIGGRTEPPAPTRGRRLRGPRWTAENRPFVDTAKPAIVWRAVETGW